MVSKATVAGTYCEEVYVGVRSVVEVVEAGLQVRAWPNPMGAKLWDVEVE